MSEEFKREVRYIVTKIKTGKQVTCVVVEEDWPEYETVWRMIQDRMEGHPNELEQLSARNAELERQLAEANERFSGECARSIREGYRAVENFKRAEQAESNVRKAQELLDKAHAAWMEEVETSGRNAANAREQKKRAEQAEQRIAESRRQKPVLWIESDPSAANESPVGALFSTVYSTAIRKEKPSSTKNQVWELYASPIVPPDVEEAVKAERERIGSIIHYPECWDTMAYPTLEDALLEIHFCSQCYEKRDDAIRARGKT